MTRSLAAERACLLNDIRHEWWHEVRDDLDQLEKDYPDEFARIVRTFVNAIQREVTA